MSRASASVSRHAAAMIAALVGLGLSGAALALCADPPRAGADWPRCLMDGQNLRGATLTGARLRDSSFLRADLAGADLNGVDGFRAKFIRARMDGAQMRGAELLEADFTSASLKAALLAGADLRRARFSGADLTGADLTGTKLDGADFTRADLSEALWSDGRRCAVGSRGVCR